MPRSRKPKYKSAAHKRLNEEHQAWLRSLTSKRKGKLRPVQQSAAATSRGDIEEHRKKYPSLDDRGASNSTAAQPRTYLKSDTHTVAVGYNKGGYQVLPKEDLPTAGRKV